MKYLVFLETNRIFLQNLRVADKEVETGKVFCIAFQNVFQACNSVTFVQNVCSTSTAIWSLTIWHCEHN